MSILRSIHTLNRTKFFVVGDPLQSIMSVGGARPELLGSFGREIAARTDIELLENYRSSRPILSLADSLCPRATPMAAVGNNKDYTQRPEWRVVPSMLNGVADIFVPALKKHGIELSAAAVLANRWTSLLPLSRGLRDRQIPAIGPGTRPYKRAHHIIAPLVEEMAAHVSEGSPGGVTRIRRELRRLVQVTTGGSGTSLGFAGDVCAERLIRCATKLQRTEGTAVGFLDEISKAVSTYLSDAALAPKNACLLMEQSGQAMLLDIKEHEKEHRLKTTTISDLGLFSHNSKSIRLLTMHGSKGREYDAVAVVDVFDGHVPFYKCTPGDEIEAEGRRLLYVAITRARRLLMLFTLQKPGDKTQASRFLQPLFPGGPKP